MLTELEWQLLFREFQGVQFNNFAAIFSGDLHAIRSLFASPHTDNLSQRVRATLIRYAVIKNNLPILCEIIKNDQHDYINKKIIGGKTFLHYAIKNNQLSLVKLLIEHGAYINYQPEHADIMFYNDRQPIHEAIRLEQTEILNYLIDSGADMDLSDSTARTCLHYAIQCSNIDAARLLIKKGANLNAQDIFGKTCLHDAVLLDYPDLVDFLISSGACLNIQEGTGQNPLHVAMLMGNSRVINKLIQAGADIRAKDRSGKTPLELAISASGVSLLINAVMNHDFELVQIWLEHDLNIINWRDNNFCTLLHYAAFYNNISIIDLLLDIKPEMIDLFDVKGYKASDYAKNLGNYEFLEILADRESSVPDGFYAVDSKENISFNRGLLLLPSSSNSDRHTNKKMRQMK